MKNQILFKSSFWGKMTFAVLMLLCAATFASAQGVTFAQFSQRPNLDGQTLRDFVFDNDTTNGQFRTVNTGSPIRFEYQNISGLPAELSGPQDARIFITSTTTTPASTNFGATPPRVTQPFSGTVTIQILRETPASPGSGTGARTNLLTAVITPVGASQSSLAGDDGSNSAGYSASTPDQNIVYSSDFINFTESTTVSRNLALALSAVTPNFSVGPGGFLASFISNATGTFAASAAPGFFPPTAAGATVSGRVLTRKGTGVANAAVTLTSLTGESVTAYTNNFGYYKFTDVMAGQSVTLSVKSKQYRYEVRTINIGEDIAGFDFVPQ